MKGTGFNLEFLQEPAMLVGLDGAVYGTNSSARGLFASGDATSLFDLAHDGREDVVAFLRRASASTSSHFGSLNVTRHGEIERFRALAARMACSEVEETLLILRLLPIKDDQFSLLNRRLREMDKQLHQRRKENAILQETLSENKVLVRELQHRVKNNIQQMLTLIRLSATNRRSPEVDDVVNTASHRLQAMSFTQEAIYRNANTGALSARSFLDDVVKGTAESYGTLGELVVSIDEGYMSSEEAHCLALIANELITNAFKHGIGDQGGTVSVRFAASRDGHCLEVHDSGPGLNEEATSRASGLILVRGLCRQIGGKFEIAYEQGAKCSVHFHSELR